MWGILVPKYAREAAGGRFYALPCMQRACWWGYGLMPVIRGIGSGRSDICCNYNIYSGIIWIYCIYSCTAYGQLLYKWISRRKIL